MGLVFEAKERPDSRVLVRVGDALDLDEWIAEHSADSQELTDVLEARLRGVTLNFASAERAARAVHLARVLGALAGAPAPVGQPAVARCGGGDRAPHRRDGLRAHQCSHLT